MLQTSVYITLFHTLQNISQVFNYLPKLEKSQTSLPNCNKHRLRIYLSDHNNLFCFSPFGFFFFFSSTFIFLGDWPSRIRLLLASFVSYQPGPHIQLFISMPAPPIFVICLIRYFSCMFSLTIGPFTILFIPLELCALQSRVSETNYQTQSLFQSSQLP